MLFTFPSRYCYAIGRQKIFSLARRFSRIPTDSLRFRSTRVLRQRLPRLSHTGLSPPLAGLSSPLLLGGPNGIPRLRQPQRTDPQPQAGNAPGFNAWPGLGSCPFARRYSGNRCYFLFLQVLRWFNSLSPPRPNYVFARPAAPSTGARSPHSEISGSKLACSSPKLIAAGRVFLQSLAPRHPP